MDLNLIGELIKTIKDPAYNNEELILYFNKIDRTYNLARSTKERYDFETLIAQDIIAINKNGFDHIYTKNVGWVSRHYGQELLNLVNSTNNNTKIAKDSINIISNAILVTNQIKSII